MVSRVVFSKKSDHWATPDAAYAALNAEFNFTFDPTPLYGQHGLSKPWSGRVFCNPPYSNISAFLEKAITELAAGNCEIAVFLLPSRTGTAWFHECCLRVSSEIRFLRGRLKFGGATTNAPFDSLIAIFK